MDEAIGLVAARGVRKRRSVAEKRRIVELTLQPGASVALVARAQGVNANQVFAWRRELRRGELAEPRGTAGVLLPVTVSAGSEAAQSASSDRSASGLIHLEFCGQALLRIETGADPTLLRVVLESLRK